jgi:Short C-terminal domain/Bacterial PH domain/Protein of unknown function (DUF2510)
MDDAAAWKPDPTGAHELRYWNGTIWTEHVSDGGVTAVDFMPADAGAAPPEGGAAAAPATPSGKGSWKDKLKSAATQAAAQTKQLAESAKEKMAEQQAKRIEQYKDDPNTLWFGESQTAATKATGMSKAFYRITKDKIWIDTGMLGVRSENVPMWAIKDIDVRQSVLQRGKDVGDVALHLEDPLYSVDQSGAYGLTGQVEPGGGGTHTSGEVLLDNIEKPFEVRDLLMPLVSEARHKKLVERQSQFINVNPGSAIAAGMAMGGGVPAAPAPAAGPSPDAADQLRKLAQLRDEGILTDEEFAAQKAKLLGG